MRRSSYIVTGDIPLSKQSIGIDEEGYSTQWCEGEKYQIKRAYYLCRCGQSKNKPFCDGTHSKIGFEGSETASRETYLNRADKIQGPIIDLTDVKILCAAARFCDRGGGIWELIKNSDNPKAKMLATEEATQCPSGRLVVWDKNRQAIEPKFDPSIIVVEDPQEDMQGPLWARGGIPIESADGYVYEIRNRVTLCRCGKTSQTPFCDASHCRDSGD